MNALRRMLHLLRWLLLGLVLVAINPWRSDAEQAGSVAVVSGRASATGSGGITRLLNDGDPIYAGDLIITGGDSYAQLDFEDGGVLTLRPFSQVRIDAFHFEAASHEVDQPAQEPVFESAVFHLLKGGFRAVSGLIGHISHDDYVVVAPTATIGIRGTEYDLRYCQNDCGDEAENGASPANGLYAGVNKGAIALRNEGGESEVAMGQAAIAPAHQQAAYLLQQPPAALRHMALPPLLAQRAAVMSQRIEQRRIQRLQQPAGVPAVPRYVPRLLPRHEPPSSPSSHTEAASRIEPQKLEPARPSPQDRHEATASKGREQTHRQSAGSAPRESAQGRQETRGPAPSQVHGREPPATIRQPQSQPPPQPQTRLPPPSTRTPPPSPRVPVQHPPASKPDNTRKPHQ